METNARVVGLALRSAVGGPMRLLEEATLIVGGGVDGDVKASPKRGVTFLSREQWQETIDSLEVDLPWHTRRANVLVEGVRLPEWLGRRVRVGDAVVHLLGETEPCHIMDRQHPGLKQALMPDMRAGLHGRVLTGGTVRLGDALTALAEDG